MRSSQVTGKYIFDEISKIKEELKELNEGMDEVYDMGTGSLPYRLLKEQHTMKEKELRELQNTGYEVKTVTDSLAKFGF